MTMESNGKYVTLVGFCRSLNPIGDHHDLLMSNLFAQSEALAKRIIPELESSAEPELKHGTSTNTLIRRYRKLKG